MSFADYKVQQKLGEGTYCSTFRAEYIPTGEVVIIKVVRIDTDEDGIPSSCLRAISILKAFKHINIVNLRDVICEESNLRLVHEFMDRDLKSYIRRGTMNKALLRSYAFQILCSVYFLHSHGVIHQNIQPENLLINRGGLCKLTGFETSVLYNHPSSRFDGEITMLWYRAPELLIEEQTHDFAIDLWSCGCVIAEMATGSPLFTGDSPVDQLMKICTVLGTPSESDWPSFYRHINRDIPLPKGPFVGLSETLPEADSDLVDLLSRLLTLNPEKRINAKEAVKHSFFRDLPEALTDMSLKPIEYL